MVALTFVVGAAVGFLIGVLCSFVYMAYKEGLFKEDLSKPHNDYD